ncbi:MAG TPA: serine--tRNA ligase [Rhizobiales bacterium]|nr:serine--tRNA ligase [Hyphomicrobiales bacterium]
MFDTKWIRENPEKFDSALARRGVGPTSAAIIALDNDRRAHLQKLQDAQTARNAASKQIGKAMAAGDKELAEKLKKEVGELKGFIQSGADIERDINEKLTTLLSGIPNLPLDETPDGTGEEDNVVVRVVGEKRQFDFEPKQHFELGEALGMMDFETAANMSGARFVILTGKLARLERAIGQFMLDLQTEENGYTEVNPPLLVRDDAMYGTGQLPKFAEDLFATTDGRWLIPTAEVPLTNTVRESILKDSDLPRRLTALTPCFRSEAGSAGRDTRGIIRQHQFWKVEMVAMTRPEESRKELDRMTGCAEDVLKNLGLNFQVLALCTGDMGFGAQLTYDVEVWLPGQQAYREISSCSVCGDFQARRMNARFKPEDGKGTQFIHTLNGSGLAVGRTLVAVMENYQNADGSITIPKALQPYMGGLEVIKAV